MSLCECYGGGERVVERPQRRKWKPSKLPAEVALRSDHFTSWGESGRDRRLPQLWQHATLQGWMQVRKELLPQPSQLLSPA